MIDCNGNFPENPTPNDPVRGFIAIYPALSSSSPDISTFAVRLELTSSACLTIPGGNIDDGVIPVVQPCISPPVNRQLFHLLSDDNANTARILWDEQDKCLTDLGNGTVVFQSCENAQGSVFVIEFGIV
ncbi:hypothetical protein FB45DRAFT_1033656 [Roridomyces roridus]|uniref:Ricin B lectin domain-containing protein n=1 Tax=Roridomyces roridus TaxID=1738132 RepID=A0AAD7FDZ8_9AGAR|nr:hypothetical protein FB45DRAFT_1033656 [Roridomyces roridus]